MTENKSKDLRFTMNMWMEIVRTNLLNDVIWGTVVYWREQYQLAKDGEQEKLHAFTRRVLLKQ